MPQKIVISAGADGISSVSTSLPHFLAMILLGTSQQICYEPFQHFCCEVNNKFVMNLLNKFVLDF